MGEFTEQVEPRTLLSIYKENIGMTGTHIGYDTSIVVHVPF